MNDRLRLVEVAPDLPLYQTYHYRIPQNLVDTVAPGKRLLVPMGRRAITGYALSLPEDTELNPAKIKDIISVLDPEPLFDKHMLELFRFAADYYFAPLGQVLKAALPGGINIASRRMLRLSDTGAKALEDGSAKGRARELLQTLDDLGEVYADRLEQIMEQAVSDSTIRGLEKKGWLEIEQQVSRARVRPRTERGVRISESIDPKRLAKLKRRAPEQTRLLQMIGELGTTRLSDLKTEFSDPARLAKRLAEQGLLQIVEMEISRSPKMMDLGLEIVPERLMDEQAQALKEIESVIEKSEFSAFLLRGITGSGKTEVYLRAISTVLDHGREALVLVPEIALTPQLINRFRQRFPEEGLAVLHSGLADGERLDQWLRIHRGEARIVIGARSAVFAPLKNLGLIVVDEEHESAYKQEEGFTYNARDLAVYRARLGAAIAVLGSATPSVESMFNTERENSKYRSLILSRRVHDRPLPQTEVVDMREALSEPTSPEEAKVSDAQRGLSKQAFSTALQQSLIETLDAGNQAILFLNRRGFSSMLICLDCGARFMCPNCQVSLTWHQKRTAAPIDYFYGEVSKDSYLMCHHCGFHMNVPDVCPNCSGIRVRNYGLGTERVEEEVKLILPDARVRRMDADTMGGKSAYFELLDSLRRGEVDVLVGTQMVAKGHDLPGVTLVGVLLADLGLNQPDFRAGERTFQILTQVAGRAGRGEKPGRVIIQTFNPDNPAIKLALTQDYEKFYSSEIIARQELSFPPFQRLVNFRISAQSKDNAASAARALSAAARATARRKNFAGRIRLLGPAPSPLSRLRGKSRFQMLAGAESVILLGDYCREVYAAFTKKKIPGRVRLDLDRDPQSLL